jgi:hypothetical protein
VHPAADVVVVAAAAPSATNKVVVRNSINATETIVATESMRLANPRGRESATMSITGMNEHGMLKCSCFSQETFVCPARGGQTVKRQRKKQVHGIGSQHRPLGCEFRARNFFCKDSKRTMSNS